MTDCSKYTDMISAMIDGELPTEQELQLRAHMETCPDCRRVYDAFAAISGALGDDLMEPPEALVKGTMFKINMQQGKSAKKRRFAFGRFTAIAACFAIIVFGMSRFGLLDGLKSSADPGQANEAYDAPEAGHITGGDLDMEIDINIPGELVLPKQEARPSEQPESSDDPVSEDEPGAALFGNGSELTNDLLVQETEQFRSEVSKLFETAGIKVYQGKYDPAAEKSSSSVPVCTVSETETLKKLAELLKPEALLKDKVENLTAENTAFTILIPANKSANSEAKDVLLTIWNVDDKLICQKDGDTPIRFTVKTIGSELEEYISKLTA